MVPLDGMAARHRRGVTAKRLSYLITARDIPSHSATLIGVSLGPDKILLVPASSRIRIQSSGYPDTYCIQRGRDGSVYRALTGMSVARIQPPPPDFPCLGLGNLAVSQPPCFLWIAWQLSTERVLRLNDYRSVQVDGPRQNQNKCKAKNPSSSEFHLTLPTFLPPTELSQHSQAHKDQRSLSVEPAMNHQLKPPKVEDQRTKPDRS
ncbi:hypothetical protein T265_14499, partial [Opisthorchis viverrini]